MPVYEYACKECENRFEKMQPITADPLIECPNCGKNALRRVFHPVGVIFKGSGWYITDNRNSSNSTTPADKGTESKSDGADKGETKSEPKSETKAEAKPEAKSGSTSGDSSGGTTTTPAAPAKSATD